MSGHPESRVGLTVSPFDYSDGDAEMTGMYGVVLNSPTSNSSGGWFSTAFPSVYVTAGGAVEFGETRVTRQDAAAWFRAVADYLAPLPDPDPTEQGRRLASVTT